MFKKLLMTAILLANTTVVLAQSHIIYLTRHAEKVSTGKNPALTEQGQQRATNIAQLLANAEITHIFSTAYKRTQLTAQPLADVLSVAVQSYNPRQLAAFAIELKTLKGNTLVVGHSNTTPALVQLLSGSQIDEMAEDEFDRLYQVIIDDNNHLTVVLLSSTHR
jgi:broad specificity phosphatase PhoE